MEALVTSEGQTVQVKHVAKPQPAAGEILVRVHYVAQNPTDWKGAASVPPGRIVGCDFAGTVADPNGSKWQEGQRVAGFVQGNSENPLRGAFAEYLLVEASLVYPIPDSIAFRDAAAVPLALATAVQALFQRLGLPEPTAPATSAIPILIYGGSTSVGQYAIQLSKLAGLFVIATGSKRNHELLKQLGADATLDYNDADWVEQAHKLTNDNLQHAFDCISEIDTATAAAKTLSSTKGGHLICILPRKSNELHPPLEKVKVESTIVYTVFERAIQYRSFENCGGPTPNDKAFWEKYLQLLPEYLEQGKIKPNPVRERGGIRDIEAGFQEHREGKVFAEKLVYKIY